MKVTTDTIKVNSKVFGEATQIDYNSYAYESDNIKVNSQTFGEAMRVEGKEGTPLPEKKQLSELTWSEIKTVLQAGDVNSNNQWVVNDEVWFNVGDEKPITLSNNETLALQIIDFKHDKDSSNNTIPATFATKELMATNHRMNSTTTNDGGWSNSEMYIYLQGTVYDLLPDDLKAVITPAVKASTEGNMSSTILSSTDKLFLLSYSEVGFGTEAPYNEEGTQYPYFFNDTRRTKAKVGGSDSEWWLRSPYTGNSRNFYNVNIMGLSPNNQAISKKGVCFAFCI